ncbi:MAG: transglycosylase domain-containing protein [Clostridia bacterium]|nr:transglycosylase domain-containing protein [Clostridia bacterium]
MSNKPATNDIMQQILGFLDLVGRKTTQYALIAWRYLREVLITVGAFMCRLYATLSAAKPIKGEQTSPAPRKPGRKDSATGSLYDEYERAPKKSSPAWWNVTKGIFRFLFRGIATVLLICVITGCIVGVTSMIYVLVYLDKDIDFDLNALKLSYTSVIYVDDGSGNYVEDQKLHGSENREWVDYDQIPQSVKDAVVAIEDHRFWTHSGVDWRRTIFAFGNMFLHLSDSQQGGSTITQQLIKNVTNENEVSIDRKLKEIFRALELEKRYPKPLILEAYLNVIALGNGCNGIQAASKTYFNKDVSQLTVPESACLVGITKNPWQYNPLYRPEKNKERQEQVLSEMKKYGYITAEEHETYKAEPLVFNTAAVYNPNTTSYNNWYVDQIITDLIRELQSEAGMSETEARLAVYNGGLQIYSCMDKSLQDSAEAIFKDPSNFKRFPRSVQPQCAIVVMNYTGAVKCIVGARGTKTNDLALSYASKEKRQPGSCMKPISSYGPAVEFGYLEFSTPVTDNPISLGGKSWPKNSGGVYRGNIPAVKGLEVSANCVAVRIARYITPQRSFDFMTKRLSVDLIENKKYGNEWKNDINLSASIGGLTEGVTVLEMTAAYAVFGNGGKFYEPYTYSKVLDANNKVLIEHTDKDYTQAISFESATIMNRMLRSPVTGGNGTARSAAFGGYPIFAKTGTTSDDKDRYFGGGTPYYVSCCWFGYKNPSPLEIKSPNHALVAWKKVMQVAHAGKPASGASYPQSPNVVSRSYCTISGGIAGAGCPAATGYYVRNSSMPMCPLHAGGSANDAYTRFLDNKAAFNTTASSTETTSTTTQTTPPPVITTPSSSSTTSSTSSTTSSTTSTTTTKSTTSSTTTSKTTTSKTTTSKTTTSSTTTTTTTTKKTTTTTTTTKKPTTTTTKKPTSSDQGGEATE